MNAPALASPPASVTPGSSLEMLGLGIGMCLVLFVAAATVRLARSPKTPLLERVLAWISIGLLGTGFAGTLLLNFFPPRHYDAAGRLIGEMPPEFGLCVGLVWLGLVGAICVLFARGLRRALTLRRGEGRRNGA